MDEVNKTIDLELFFTALVASPNPVEIIYSTHPETQEPVMIVRVGEQVGVFKYKNVPLDIIGHCVERVTNAVTGSQSFILEMSEMSKEQE